MIQNRISIVCSSQNNFDLLRKHTLDTCGLPKDKVEFLGYENKGSHSLSQIYNQGIADAKFDLIVFMHHDIIFETNNWGHKICKHFSRNPEYGIIGVAGTNKLISGTWWQDRSSMHGIVNHSDKIKKWTSRFSEDQGNKLKEMVVLDGVWFAIDKTKIIHKFDESFNGYHFYDLGFTFANFLAGVKIGVCTDIRITHMSIGITNDEWGINKKQFEEKYKQNLPCDLNEFRSVESFTNHNTNMVPPPNIGDDAKFTL